MDSMTQSKALLSVNPAIGRLFALDLHQVVKRRDGIPAARIEPDGGDAEPGGQLETALRVVDVLLPLGQVGRHEVLMDGQHHQVDARAKRALLEAVDVRGAFLGHLTVKNLDAVEPEPRRVVDDVLDRRRGRRESASTNNSRRPA